MEDLYLARQPIFDGERAVAGYELLFRRGPVASDVEPAEDETATLNVLYNALVELGLERIVGSHRAFINVSAAFLAAGHHRLLAPGRVVLELLEHTPVTDSLLRTLRTLVGQGHVIALDDFVLTPQRRPLLELAQIVKIDVRGFDRLELARQVDALLPAKVTLLAERVETPEEFAALKCLGFELFHGYFFARPHLVTGRGLPVERLAVMQLLARLHRPDVTIDDVIDVVRQDVTIAYKVLQAVNSGFVALPRQVDSLRAAVVLLGLPGIRRLASLLALATVDDKPAELTTTALVRARMCEQLAASEQASRASAGFTTGLLSTLDAYVDLPLADAINRLPLTEDVTAALVHQKGWLGEVLAAVLAYEHADDTALQVARFPLPVLATAYLEAIDWASQTWSTVVAPD